MDKQGRRSKKENKKAQITIQPGAGNIGGLVVIGASLAIAGLVGTFFVHKTKRRHSKKNDGPQKGDEKTKGVSSVLQNSEPTFLQSECCKSYESAKMVLISTQMDSSEPVSAKSLILEDNLVPKINGSNENSTCDHQNILLAYDTSTTSALGVLVDVCNELKLSPLPELDEHSIAETNHKMESIFGEDSAMTEDFEVEVKMDHQMESDSQEDSALKDDFEVETETDLNMESTPPENSAMKENFQVETDHKMESNSQDNSTMKEDFQVEMDSAMDEAFESTTHVEEEEESVAAEKESLEKLVLRHPLQGEQEDKEGYADNYEEKEIRKEEYILEKLEDGSEGTGSSSTESNSEAVWPAELLSEMSLAWEYTRENQQILEEKIVHVDTTTKTNKSNHFDNGKCDILKNGGDGDDCEVMKNSEFFVKGRISETMLVGDQVENGVKNGFWIGSLLALLLCCYYYLPIITVCLTVLLIVVISLYYNKV